MVLLDREVGVCPVRREPRAGLCKAAFDLEQDVGCCGLSAITELDIKAVEFPVIEGLCKSKVTRNISMADAYHLMKIKKSN